MLTFENLLWFIKLLIGSLNAVTVGRTLDSETSSVQAVRFIEGITGRNMIIVDMPGFDDPRPGFSDSDSLKKITTFSLDE
jgi:hypothetical protein